MINGSRKNIDSWRASSTRIAPQAAQINQDNQKWNEAKPMSSTKMKMTTIDLHSLGGSQLPAQANDLIYINESA